MWGPMPSHSQAFLPRPCFQSEQILRESCFSRRYSRIHSSNDETSHLLCFAGSDPESPKLRADYRLYGCSCNQYRRCFRPLFPRASTLPKLMQKALPQRRLQKIRRLLIASFQAINPMSCTADACLEIMLFLFSQFSTLKFDLIF